MWGGVTWNTDNYTTTICLENNNNILPTQNEANPRRHSHTNFAYYNPIRHINSPTKYSNSMITTKCRVVQCANTYTHFVILLIARDGGTRVEPKTKHTNTFRRVFRILHYTHTMNTTCTDLVTVISNITDTNCNTGSNYNASLALALAPIYSQTFCVNSNWVNKFGFSLVSVFDLASFAQ